MSELYIGLMSGTSLDGIDAALVDFSQQHVKLVAFNYYAFTDAIKQRIQTISTPNTLVSLLDYGMLDAELGFLFAECVQQLLAQTHLSASVIRAIGSHGQTVYHAPDAPAPFSLQIGDPNIIAARTGITTIADFRRRDIAVQGQGAPLVPAFHQAVFQHVQHQRCIVNIGGIANITILPSDASLPILGFDTGMGNTLLDAWITQHLGVSYDRAGQWAASGQVQYDIVNELLTDGYFHAAPPKSTGKEYFCLAWLQQHIDVVAYRPEDIQASLTYFTALTIAEAVKHYAADTDEVIVCGGGVHNVYLMQCLAALVPCAVRSSVDYGIDPDHVEAMAFAWLARQTDLKLTGNLTAVTGASQPVVLGGIYRA